MTALPRGGSRVRLLKWFDHKGKRIPSCESVGTVMSIDRTTFTVLLDGADVPIMCNPNLGDEWVPEDGAVVLPFRHDEELRALVGALLDAIVLDHAMASTDWGRLLVLTGRFCDPFVSVNPCKIWVSK